MFFQIGRLSEIPYRKIMGIISPTYSLLKTGEEATLRSASLDDAAALLFHSREIIHEESFFLTTPDEFDLTEEQEREFIREYLDDPSRLLIVAEVGGRIVGMLFFECGSRKRLAHRGTLHLSVRREWRGRGLGTSLLHSLIAWAEAHPVVEKLSLSVFATNTAAIGLYRKFGFVEEGRQPREIKLGPENYVDQILMYKIV